MPQIPQSDALSEANPSSIQDLFSRNPEQLTQTDLETLIAYFNQIREDLASSGTIRHARVRKDALFEQTLAANSDKLDFSDL